MSLPGIFHPVLQPVEETPATISPARANRVHRTIETFMANESFG
jgi:hypothetical protein